MNKLSYYYCSSKVGVSAMIELKGKYAHLVQSLNWNSKEGMWLHVAKIAKCETGTRNFHHDKHRHDWDTCK